MLWGYCFTLLLLHFAAASGLLKCHQCSGWHGRGYPAASREVSTCDNLNNQCQTQQYCVKKIDPVIPSKHYVTYTSDCWQTHQIQVNPTNLSIIVSGQCYPYEDGSVPVKRWIYCFCNNADYCNRSNVKLPTLKIFYGMLASLVLPTLL